MKGKGKSKGKKGKEKKRERQGKEQQRERKGKLVERENRIRGGQNRSVDTVVTVGNSAVRRPSALNGRGVVRCNSVQS